MTCNIEIFQFWQKGNTAYFITDDGRVLSARAGTPLATLSAAVAASIPSGGTAGNTAPVSPADSVPAFSASGKYREIASFNGKGYRRVRIQGKNFKVHRLVAEAFVPNPDNFPHVLHIDGDRHNNHYTNLEWSKSQSNHK